MDPSIQIEATSSKVESSSSSKDAVSHSTTRKIFLNLGNSSTVSSSTDGATIPQSKNTDKAGMERRRREKINKFYRELGDITLEWRKTTGQTTMVKMDKAKQLKMSLEIIKTLIKKHEDGFSKGLIAMEDTLSILSKDYLVIDNFKRITNDIKKSPKPRHTYHAMKYGLNPIHQAPSGFNHTPLLPTLPVLPTPDLNTQIAHNSGPLASTSNLNQDLRKMDKREMERQRRSKNTQYISQLMDIAVEWRKTTGQTVMTKMQKTEVLKMTVEIMKTLRDENHAFEDGFGYGMSAGEDILSRVSKDCVVIDKVKEYRNAFMQTPKPSYTYNAWKSRFNQSQQAPTGFHQNSLLLNHLVPPPPFLNLYQNPLLLNHPVFPSPGLNLFSQVPYNSASTPSANNPVLGGNNPPSIPAALRFDRPKADLWKPYIPESSPFKPTNRQPMSELQRSVLVPPKPELPRDMPHPVPQSSQPGLLRSRPEPGLTYQGHMTGAQGPMSRIEVPMGPSSLGAAFTSDPMLPFPRADIPSIPPVRAEPLDLAQENQQEPRNRKEYPRQHPYLMLPRQNNSKRNPLAELN